MEQHPDYVFLIPAINDARKQQIELLSSSTLKHLQAESSLDGKQRYRTENWPSGDERIEYCRFSIRNGKP